MPSVGSTQADQGSRRALEVTAMYCDSVMAIRHLEPNPARLPGRYSRRIFMAAALLLGMSALAFLQSVRVADQNAAGYRTHISQEKPAHEFRPRVLHGVWEGMGLGGALGGLLLITLAFARQRGRTDPGGFQIGGVAGTDYPAQLAGDTSFQLVHLSADRGLVLQVPSAWDAELQGPSGLSMASGGFRTCAIDEETKAHLRCGDHRFFIRSVAAPRKQSLPLLAGLDTRFVAFLCGSTIAVVGLMWLLETHYAVEKTLYSDLFATSPRISDYRVIAKEKELLRPAMTNGYVRGPIGGTGTSMVGPSSAMGARSSDRTSGRYSITRRQDEPQLARGRAMDQAREAGVLGLLRQNPFMAAPGTSNAFSSGTGAADVYGGLIGNQVGETSGAWGYGLRGVGTGSEGTGWGTIGAGHYGTIGHGSGTGSGWGSGHGLGVNGHEARPPGVRIGNASAIGDLDKNIIRRYIRRKIPRIRHCYERALLADPDLEGTVESVFQISPIGEVMAAETSGMENDELHACVSASIASIAFPKPRGGGFVAVTYPFTFVPAH